MRIGLDAMGGDHAPREIVRGAVDALSSVPEIEILLVGQEDPVRAELAELDYPKERLQVEHASQIIGMDEPPIESLRQKRDSSIARLIKLATEKRVDALISAGNTGAFVAGAQLKLGTLEGVARPGISAVIPTFHGPLVVCDVGANVAAKPHHLHDYAVMACIYSERVIGVKSPRVGLMSIGEEEVKGNELVKQTRDLLKADKSLTYVGNVEGGSLFSGECDVAVCDGFVGNIVLKLTEGLSEGLIKTIAREIAEVSPTMAPQFEPVVKAIYKKHDYTEYGGAPLLGVNGVCIVCHGRSDRRAIRNAIRVASEVGRLDLNARVVESLAS